MGRTPCCEKIGLKKGKWTAEEDEKLINYIKANGDGSWRSLPKNAGLLRCGKSCRLRWINYLREDVKRGNFSAEEEETIVRMHKTLGNKWSLIASHLPGRTDNEIKNYWNSHLSRRIYRFRSIDALTDADVIKIMRTTNKRRVSPMARGPNKKSKQAEEINEDTNPRTDPLEIEETRGVDEDILMQFLGDRSKEEDTTIDKEVNWKECGDWRLNIENVDLYGSCSPIIPCYNCEELRWGLNGGDEELDLWNYGEEGECSRMS